MVAAPMFNWTGFYAGLHAGYGWGDIHQFDSGGRSPDFDWDGFVGGGTLGYNWQTGAWVFGVEADISWSDIRGRTSSSSGWGCVVSNGCINEIDWFGTLRGRVGFAANQSLVYVTGGLAYGRVFGALGNGCGVACVSETETGWTAGAGFEWAFAPNWSAKAEYLFVDLGRSYDGNTDIGMDSRFNVVRAGINYRFATGKAPAVVSKY